MVITLCMRSSLVCTSAMRMEAVRGNFSRCPEPRSRPNFLLQMTTVVDFWRLETQNSGMMPKDLPLLSLPS